MEMATIINGVLSLFLIMLAGVYGSKNGIISDDASKGLTKILLEIALPCMIITSFNFSYDIEIKNNMIKTFYYSFLAYIIMAILSKLLLLPIRNERKVILHFANIFTNTGYIGFPILNAVYGPEAVIYGAIFNMFFVIFLWTYGVMIFKGRMERDKLLNEIYKALRNPSLIAVYLGIAMMLLNLKLSTLILMCTSSIGSMTGPMSMIVVGVLSCKLKVKEHLRDWTIYYGITLKLIVIPAILYIISCLVQDKAIIINSILILASMPAAAMTSIFADSFNIKKEYAAVIVVTTTLLSLLTLPILLHIII